MNGDSQDSLVTELSDAYAAIDAAMDSVRKLTVHGRNYQTLENAQEAYQKDRDWKCERMDTLNNLKEEMMSIALEIQEQ